MGERHVMTSTTLAPSSDALPDWFVEKHSKNIEFDYQKFESKHARWFSKHEYKLYMYWETFFEDLKKVVKEIDIEIPFRLSFVSCDNFEIEVWSIEDDSVDVYRTKLYEMEINDV